MAWILQFEALRHWLKKRENWQIWRDFQWFLNNQWGCGEIDFTVEFRASNMPKYPLKGSSNRRERRPGKGILKQKNGYVFGYRGWTTGDTAKRMVPLDSAHQIGLFTCIEDVLIVVGGSSSLDFKKQRNRSRFWLYLHNQGQYGNMDDGVGFSVSTRFIYAPERRSNGSWGLIVSGSKKREIGDVISDSSIPSDRTGKWTAVFWLAASNKLKCGPEWRGYCSLRPYVIG